MNKNATVIAVLILIALAVIGVGAYFVSTKQTASPKPSAPTPIACTQEAKLCPDGSYVGRTGKNCAFAPCPTTNPPINKQCSGPNDTSCPYNYSCVQGCGSPVSFEGEPPAPYYCQPKGYIRMCPICLSENTLIDTPDGAIPVQNLKTGDTVWSTDKSGQRVSAVIIKTGKTPVPPTHQVVHLTLDDGREVIASPKHPTADGRTVGELSVGEILDGSHIVSAVKELYDKGYTYDILPSGQTGFYWANGILLGSTLR